MRNWMIAISVIGLAASVARADLHDVELVGTLSLADRSTTGTPDELSSYGYANDAGLLADLEARTYFDLNEYFSMGFYTGVAHQAGALLGMVDGYAFQTTMIDAGLAARFFCPCISRGAIHWYASGVIGVTGAVADAGTGDHGVVNGDQWNERVAASSRLDHGGLGWRLALSFDGHWGPMIFGIGIGLRQYFGVDTAVARGLMMDVGIRLGADFGN